MCLKNCALNVANSKNFLIIQFFITAGNLKFAKIKTDSFKLNSLQKVSHRNSLVLCSTHE